MWGCKVTFELWFSSCFFLLPQHQSLFKPEQPQQMLTSTCPSHAFFMGAPGGLAPFPYNIDQLSTGAVDDTPQSSFPPSSQTHAKRFFASGVLTGMLYTFIHHSFGNSAVVDSRKGSQPHRVARIKTTLRETSIQLFLYSETKARLFMSAIARFCTSHHPRNRVLESRLRSSLNWQHLCIQKDWREEQWNMQGFFFRYFVWNH